MRSARVDANHEQIVSALRAAGASVQSLARMGGGVPDLVVGIRGANWLFEVKDPKQPPNKRRLTADQMEWFAGWRGQVAVVYSPDDALALLELI